MATIDLTWPDLFPFWSSDWYFVPNLVRFLQVKER